MPAYATRSAALEHEVLAAVLQVRTGTLNVLLWRRALDPDIGRWSLPGGRLGLRENVETSIRRHLAEKVDLTQLKHVEELAVFSAPGRVPGPRVLATTFLGLVPSDADPVLPADTSWHPIAQLPRTAFDHDEIAHHAHERLRAKLSYTNIGFALAPPAFTISALRDLYAAALGHRLSATNLQRVLSRRDVLHDTGETARPGSTGGRPAALFSFRSQRIRITDPFAIFRPPEPDRGR